ncbi:MAG: hypothetical protein ABI405_13970 [Parafilimonas sp.]
MNATDWIGTIGVTLLLLAFFLSSIKKIGQHSLLYIALNCSGAAMACFASVLLHYMPFIILEGTWTLVSVIILVNYFIKK